MYRSWQASQIAPSQLFERRLRREVGDEFWLEVAADLNQAVHEWGQFVEAKVEEAVNRYVEQIRRANRNTVRNLPKGAKMPEMQRPSRDRIRQLTDEQISYWAYETVKVYTATVGSDLFEPGGTAVLVKKATYNPLEDWDLDDAEEVYL